MTRICFCAIINTMRYHISMNHIPITLRVTASRSFHLLEISDSGIEVSQISPWVNVIWPYTVCYGTYNVVIL